jgi:hypothetical protein
MGEEQSTSTQGGNTTTSEATPGAGDGFKPITSQDELNRIIGERVKRAKPADYEDLRAKAARLDEIEQANKTEAQKAAERLAKAEQTAQQAEARALRREVALEHKLSKDDAALLDAITDEDAMRRLAGRLAQGAEDRSKKSNHVPREGTHTKTAASDERETVRQLFG